MPEVLLQRVTSRDEMTSRAAELVLWHATDAIDRRGRFLCALAGGSTPRPVYERLAATEGIDWSRWMLFWSDERAVPPNHAESNFKMVNEALIRPLAEQGLAPGRVERLRGELPPAEAATAYETEIRSLAVSGIPNFDLIMLGMGSDAHTASLFPHTSALSERDRLVVANPVSHLGVTRLTFTFPLINAARQILFLVSGTDKSAALAHVFGTETDIERWPCQGVQPIDGAVTWLVDEAAAGQVALTR